MTTKFEPGRTYATRSICDHNCIVEVEVLSRTAQTIKTMTGKGPKTLRVYVYEGVEKVRPWGSYSMAPIVGATDLAPANADARAYAAVAAALGVAA